MLGLKKNVISNFILTASTILLPLITFPYVTRTLSNISLGNVFFVDAFTQYFILFSSLGIPYYGIREVAKLKGDAKQVSTLVFDLIILQVALSIITIITFFVFGAFLPKLSGVSSLIEIGSIMILASSFLIEWFFQGIENFAYITKRSLVFKGLSVLSILLFVKAKGDSEIYYLILTLVVFCNALLNFFFFLKYHSQPYQISKNILRHLRPLIVLFSINVSVSVYVILDSIILGFLTDAVNVSYYNIPLKLVKIFWMIIAGIGTVFIPRISSYYASNDMDSIQLLMNKSISIVCLLSLPFCFACLLFPKEILVIISGEQYLTAASALQVLSCIPLIIGICNVFGSQFLLPIGREKHILHATMIGLIVSLLLNFLLIPYYKFLGSAIAAVAAELSVCIFVFFSARKYIKITFDYLLLVQIAICLSTSFVFYLLVRKYAAGIYIIIGTGIIYIISLVLTQFYFKNKFLLALLDFSRRVKV
ncbi:MAG: flippase [Chryseobacterium sp.]|nr:MAG: flippase [Chryseobacterium sp.]